MPPVMGAGAFNPGRDRRDPAQPAPSRPSLSVIVIRERILSKPCASIFGSGSVRIRRGISCIVSEPAMSSETSPLVISKMSRVEGTTYRTIASSEKIVGPGRSPVIRTIPIRSGIMAMPLSRSSMLLPNFVAQ